MNHKPKILIAGGTGLVGSRLTQMLQQKGYQVKILTRRPKGRENHFAWDIKSQTIDIKAFDQVKHVINLAGVGIADKLWTKARKKLIVNSRVQSNLLLIEKIDRHRIPISSYISASAVGIYGDQGNQWLTENHIGNPEDFMVDTCMKWENTLNHPTLNSIRKVRIRIGLVLAKDGGVMPKLLASFKTGFGAYFGNGKQYYPWIHIDDLCRIFIKAIEDDSIQGAYNGVAPNPHTNKDLIKGIGEQLGKNWILPIPALALKIGMGELSSVVLNSNRVSADKILAEDFEFRFADLTSALKDLL